MGNSVPKPESRELSILEQSGYDYEEYELIGESEIDVCDAIRIMDSQKKFMIAGQVAFPDELEKYMQFLFHTLDILSYSSGEEERVIVSNMHWFTVAINDSVSVEMKRSLFVCCVSYGCKNLRFMKKNKCSFTKTFIRKMKEFLTEGHGMRRFCDEKNKLHHMEKILERLESL